MGPFLGGFVGLMIALLWLVLAPLLRIDAVAHWSDSLGSWFRLRLEAIGSESGRLQRWFAKPLLIVLLQVQQWTDSLENRYFRGAVRIFLYVNILLAAIWVCIFVLALLAIIALALVILGIIGSSGKDDRTGIRADE